MQKWVCTQLLKSKGFPVRGFHTCIIGSGPSGFYTAQHLLKKRKNVRIDMIEKLPVPYGLIRYGVAPFHQDIKNCIASFESLAKDPRFRLIGNLEVGEDLDLLEILPYYEAVVLCYGRSEQKKLEIEGENLPDVYSSNDFVGWYNGYPFSNHINPNLSGRRATIIGNGNVALDVARILLMPPSQLAETDITGKAMEALRRSNITHVDIVGRRGPSNVSFTTKELRDLTKNKGCQMFHTDSIHIADDQVTPFKRRLFGLLSSIPKYEGKHSSEKRCLLHFNKKPLRIQKKCSTTAEEQIFEIVFECENGDPYTIETNLIIYCIGYNGKSLHPSLPFDSDSSVIKHIGGRVSIDSNPPTHAKLYCAGWIKTGSKGALIDTMASSYQSAQTILNDFEGEEHLNPTKNGIIDLMEKKGKQFITFDEWKKIDNEEIRMGRGVDKIREKMTDVGEMMRIAKG